MNLSTSTKVLIPAVVSFAGGLIMLAKAGIASHEQMERLGGFSPAAEPGYNSWHVLALTFFAFAIGLTIAARILQRSDSKE